MDKLIQNLCPKLGSGLLSAVNVMSQRRRHPSKLNSSRLILVSRSVSAMSHEKFESDLVLTLLAN